MKQNLYETKQYLNEYLFFHYGRAKDFCPFPFAPQEALNFHRRIIDECLPPLSFSSSTYGLDLGCAVGRLTFELARVVDFALGIDRSRSFIRAARQMAHAKKMKIYVKEEGNIFSVQNIKLPKRLSVGHVKFKIGDAQSLTSLRSNSFHVVLAINLIDRMAHPRKFLEKIRELLIPGGRLIIGSPYTWMKEYTPFQRWLGGYQRRGRACFSSETLHSILKPSFRFVSRHDLPFLIREHRRKYQWSVSEISVLIRES